MAKIYDVQYITGRRVTKTIRSMPEQNDLMEWVSELALKDPERGHYHQAKPTPKPIAANARRFIYTNRQFRDRTKTSHTLCPQTMCYAQLEGTKSLQQNSMVGMGDTGIRNYHLHPAFAPKILTHRSPESRELK